MEDHISDWSTLVKKYIRDEITPEEMEILERQMKASPIKRQQFHRHTDPEVVMKQLEEMYYADRQGDFESFIHQHDIILK